MRTNMDFVFLFFLCSSISWDVKLCMFPGFEKKLTRAYKCRLYIIGKDFGFLFQKGLFNYLKTSHR